MHIATVGLIIFKDINFMDSQNFALNKNFCGKISRLRDDPQNFLPHLASTHVVTRCVINLSARQWYKAITFTKIFYAHHWKDTPEPKRTRQWLWALLWLSLKTILYHWTFLSAATIPPEDIALHKLPVGDSKEKLTSRTSVEPFPHQVFNEKI